jgi:hypothetical protein
MGGPQTPPSAGWYRDPSGGHGFRYWDGSQPRSGRGAPHVQRTRIWLDPLPEGVRLRTSIGRSPDIVMVSATDRAKLVPRLAKAAEAIFPDGAIWAAWPKKSANMPTDIIEHAVRELALPLGLVDNKVCAITEVWSGLRVVWRKENRAGRP